MGGKGKSRCSNKRDRLIGGLGLRDVWYRRFSVEVFRGFSA